ncbi:RdgB/HAM1 family non-canonical purine NTP pyrophosphatase [Nocardioides yefusunii]|uniref:dITP/XTP pyrophosphatase n=1 Tax=Nocardioides yefusunii TaxID=2500546 RepID=A0ABW1QVP3_9ACTN|nr:RdgB/HAM1 family non-canonical purine NTP pyrophosphatase [Nocardioides yefusunii]
MSTDVFLASHSAKKIAEMQRILAEHVPGIRVLGLADVDEFDEPIEDEATFEGNALLKARAGVAATGLPTIADDSGLCVDALNGMPGVLSARWAGRVKSDAANNELLLEQMHDVPDVRRGAHFTCVIAFVMPNGHERVVEGRMNGRIIRETRGHGGFGYDVLFVPEEHSRAGLTSAELTPMEKDHISHRGRALREIGPLIAADLAG